jgi:HK97 family phage major capsid protein
MADVKALIEERGKLDHQLKSIIEKAEGENRNLNAEEKKTFDEVHARDMELKDRIDRHNLLAKREAEINELRTHGIDRNKVPASAAGDPPADKRNAISDEECNIAFQAWACRQFGVPLNKAQKRAAEKFASVNKRFNLSSRDFSIPLLSSGDFRSAQMKVRTKHPSIEQRDLGVSSSSIIPKTLVNNLELALLTYGPMWQVADVLSTNDGGEFTWPTANDTSNKGVRLSEATTIGSSVDPTISSMTLNAYKYSSKLILVSPELLQDSAFDLASTLGTMLGERLGRITNEEFTTANGSSKPNGIVNAATLGVTAALSNAITGDELIDLQHSVNRAYRQGAAWMMKDSTLCAIRKLTDEQGQYLFQPGLQAGVPDRLLGDVVQINDDMEGINDAGDGTDASEIVVLYGQLSKYKARRVGQIRMRRLVERYADTDQEGFVAFMRADGDLLDAGTHPVKYLQMHS